MRIGLLGSGASFAYPTNAGIAVATSATDGAIVEISLYVTPGVVIMVRFLDF
jgi:hypothetical protein